MPRGSKGPHLWLRKAWRDGDSIRAPVWIIRDAGRQFSTGFGADDRERAEQKLAEYIINSRAVPRRERQIGQIPIADVIAIYLSDVAPGQARPEKAGERSKRLLGYWGKKMLSEVTGANCRAYAAWRGNAGGARRDLQDFAAAIKHHATEGLHRELVRVALPPRGKARQRWLTRTEVARLLRVCLHTPEIQDGKPTDKRPLKHLARFLLLGLYTGSRPGAVMNAAWMKGPTLCDMDLDNEVFHRRPDGAVETNKRRPTVRLSPRLLAHLKRWKRMDAAKAPPGVYVVTFGGQKVESVKTGLRRAAELAGVPPVTAYALRHTCASWLVKKGLHTRRSRTSWERQKR
jgi:integrase